MKVYNLYIFAAREISWAIFSSIVCQNMVKLT